MEEKKLGVLGNYIYKYEGTETEKAKNEFLNIFKYKLLQYEVTLIFIEKIKMCFVLYIVIQNVGDVQDKNIIDKSVRVFHGDDYLKDDYMPVYLDMIGDEYNFIESIFKFQSDSNVKAENPNSNLNYNQSEFHINSFNNELDMYIAKTQYEDANYNVIELEVKNIRPSESKFVNKLVLLHSLNKELEIKYTIISVKSDGFKEVVLRINYQD